MKNHIINLKSFATVAGVAMSLWAVPSFAGHIHGNGGDYIRGTFIKVGQAVLEYLHDTEAGHTIITSNSLDEAKLAATLSIDVISVDELSLIDNGGSLVDAIGTEGSITLSKNVWAEHFEKSRDVYYLVFHEMLRAIAVNDDNYLISGALNPFPETRRIVTRIESVFPLLGDDNISGMINASELGVAGTGCPLGRLGTSVDVDLERNQIDLSFTNYLALAGGDSGKSVDRKNCTLALPVHVPVGKQLVVSQVDMFAKVVGAASSVSTISLEAFLAGSHGPVLRKTQSVTTDPVVGRLLLRRNDVLASNCGGADIVRLNTSAMVTSPVSTSELTTAPSLLEVDRISLSFKVEPCSQQPIRTEKTKNK